MKYSHIINAVMYQPWLITPGAHESIRKLVSSHLLEPAAAQRTANLFGEEIQLESMTVEDGIAIIPMAGVMGYKLSGIERSCGGVDVRDVMKDIDEAEDDERVTAVIFDIDSPGGMVSGTPELADRIAAMEKPNAAFTSGMCCSAAYWSASQCENIYATKSSDIGSIGVYIPWLNQVKAFANEGLEVEIFKNEAATYKAMGFPGTDLTMEQREQIQAQVEEVGLMFMDAVKKKRKNAPYDAMRGQTFMAESAASVDLIDAVVDSIDDVKKLIV